jgi:cytosine/adenosine deaminase-related metal-dependent hydrolase
MKAVMMLQRAQLHDNRAIPAGKALEMATIDAYRALGLDSELGSVEVGKKADLITVDLFQPHLRPFDEMVLQRIVYNATGGDVRDAIVDGRLVMADRRVLTIDEADLLDRAQEQSLKIAERIGQKTSFNRRPEAIWGKAFSGSAR